MKTRMMVIVAMVGVIGMAGTASAAPDLSAPDSFYVDLDGVNNDAVANKWSLNTRADYGILVNDNWMRGNEPDSPLPFTMTVPGLSPDGLYDVAVLFVDQGPGPGGAKNTLAGLTAGGLIEIGGTNGTSTMQEEALHAGWYHFQTDPGILGVGTASGAGELDIFFGHKPHDGSSGGENFLEGVVLTAIPIPEPAGLGLIGLALLAVRKKRS